MTREEAIEVISQDIPCEYDMDLIEALEMAIKALSEPTIPLSVIEKIHDAIDNADADGDIEDDYGNYIGSVLTDYHVHEIIDKAVKECTHEL